MPGILFRHIARAVLLGIALVAVLLLGLYTIVELIRESRDLVNDYGPLQMIVYLAQTSPRRFYDIFPFAALIGTMLGLGGLAAGNELVAMRAAGFDRRQILLSVLGAVAGCLLVLVLISELVVPGLEARASAMREQARSGQVHLGRYGALWLRDGMFVVRIGHSAWSQADTPEFGDVLVYRLDGDMKPQAVIKAQSATHDGSRWLLRNTDHRRIDADTATPADDSDTLTLDSTLSHDLFAASISRPRVLAMSDLNVMIDFLRANDLDADPYRQALWNRIFFPLNVLAMVLVSLPFAFRGGRHGSRGVSLFFGVTLGLGFFILTRLAQGMGLLLPGPLWLSALMPSLLVGALGVILLRRL